MTAIQLVNGYNGFGVHTFLSVIRSFPGLYKNFVFLSVSEVDVSAFKGTDAVQSLTTCTSCDLDKYVDLARKLGFAATSRFDIGTDIVHTAVEAVREDGQGVPAFDRLRRAVRLPPAQPSPQAPPQRDGVRHPAGAQVAGDHDGDPAHPYQYLGPRSRPWPKD